MFVLRILRLGKITFKNRLVNGSNYNVHFSFKNILAKPFKTEILQKLPLLSNGK